MSGYYSPCRCEHPAILPDALHPLRCVACGQELDHFAKVRAGIVPPEGSPAVSSPPSGPDFQKARHGLAVAHARLSEKLLDDALATFRTTLDAAESLLREQQRALEDIAYNRTANDLEAIRARAMEAIR